MLKLQFDWHINFTLFHLNSLQVLHIQSESNKSNVPVKPGLHCDISINVSINIRCTCVNPGVT